MTSQSGGHYSHMMDSSLTSMSLEVLIFLEERIKVGKEKAGTSALNKAYNKFQAKQDKDQTKATFLTAIFLILGSPC